MDGWIDRYTIIIHVKHCKYWWIDIRKVSWLKCQTPTTGDEFGSVKTAGPRMIPFKRSLNFSWVLLDGLRPHAPLKSAIKKTWHNMGGAIRVQSSRLEDWSKAKLQGYWHWTQASWMWKKHVFFTTFEEISYCMIPAARIGVYDWLIFILASFRG